MLWVPSFCERGVLVKTVSIYVSNLCVPCENRCRHCLLSWDGRLRGADYDRSTAYARRFNSWLKENRPELSFVFYYGYSMEHPRLLESIDFLRQIGSPGGELLQFDGMRFRNGKEIRELLASLKGHGIRLIDLTFYGTRGYHDRFAARTGDFDYMMDILRVAGEVGLDVEAGIPLTRENAHQAGELVDLLMGYSLNRLFCFVPHGEGRGVSLEPVRLRQCDYVELPERVRKCFNRQKFRPEGEWIREGSFSRPERRMLNLGLTRENMDYFENLGFAETIAYLEKLDDDYYAAVPGMPELARLYGNPQGDRFYSERDLYLTYQRRYVAENNLELPDMNDERLCFSRQF